MNRVRYLWPAIPAVAAVLLLGQAGDSISLTCDTASSVQICPSSTAENGVAAFDATTIVKRVGNANTVQFSSDINSALDQVVAFRRRRGPALLKDVNWQPGAQAVPLSYPAPADVPLRIWIICADAQGGTCNAPSQDYLDELREVPTHANFRLQYERVGVNLTTGVDWISDETGGALDSWKDFQGGRCGEFEAVVRAASPPKFQENALNVYVMQSVDSNENYGLYCDPSDIAVVANHVDWDVILHEIGHILTLQDLPVSDFEPGESKGNYMVSSPHPDEHREFFTEGQTSVFISIPRFRLPR